MKDVRTQPMITEVILPSLGNRPKRVDHKDRELLLEAVEVLMQENGRLMSGRPTPQERLDALKERIEAEVAAKYAAPPPLQVVVKAPPAWAMLLIAVIVPTLISGGGLYQGVTRAPLIWRSVPSATSMRSMVMNGKT